MSNLKTKLTEEQKETLLNYSSAGLLYSKLILEDLKIDFSTAYNKSLLAKKPNETYKNSSENIGFVLNIQDQIIERAGVIEKKYKLLEKVNSTKDIELMKLREENKQLNILNINLKQNIQL